MSDRLWAAPCAVPGPTGECLRPAFLSHRKRHRRWERSRAAAQPPEIKLVACDVDGTLLTSRQELTDRVARAVQQTIKAGVPFLLATGKAPGGEWMKLLPRLTPPGKQGVPGVFMQGLILHGPDGDVVYERHLDEEVIDAIITAGEQHGLTLMAYANDRILATVTNKHTDTVAFYKEPALEVVESLRSLVGRVPMHKMLLGDEDDRIKEVSLCPVQVRPSVQAALAGKVELTSALPGFLEVLPQGASKGAGLARLLKILDVTASNVMAIGDGENDVEMLQLVGWPVAMANAAPKVHAVAQATTASHNEDGVALALEVYVLDEHPKSGLEKSATSSEGL